MTIDDRKISRKQMSTPRKAFDKTVEHAPRRGVARVWVAGVIGGSKNSDGMSLPLTLKPFNPLEQPHGGICMALDRASVV